MPLIGLETKVCTIEQQLFDDLLVNIEVIRLSGYTHHSYVEWSLSPRILRIDI